MGVLKNCRHDQFIQLIAQGLTSRAAYQLAGYRAEGHAKAGSKARDACATRLLNYAQSQQRLAEVRAAAGKRNDVSVDSLVEELDSAISFAREHKQPAAVVQGILAKARVTGNLVSRSEAGKPGAFDQAKSVADVIAQVKAELGPKAADALLAALLEPGDEPDEPAGGSIS
jgi:hypothetical protein